MKRSLLIGLALCLCCLTTGCQREFKSTVHVDVKEAKTDYTITNVTFTTAKSYNKYKHQYSEPAVEVCMTITNNMDSSIKPLFKDATSRIRLFQRGVECDNVPQVYMNVPPLYIHGEIVDYDMSEKYILPGRSFKACQAFKLNSPTGLLEATFFYKGPNDQYPINQIITEWTL